MKYYEQPVWIVRSLRLKTYLNNKGFQELEERVDYKNNNFLVFVFSKTDSLMDAINQYYEEAIQSGELKKLPKTQ